MEKGRPSEQEIADAKARFLRYFGEGASISDAAELTGVAVMTVHRWRRNDPQFAEEFQLAKCVAADTLYLEAWRRAVEGVEEPNLFRGAPVRGPNGEFLVTRRYSDQLLIFLLKATNPYDYDDAVRAKRLEEMDAARRLSSAGDTFVLDPLVAEALNEIEARKTKTFHIPYRADGNYNLDDA